MVHIYFAIPCARPQVALRSFPKWVDAGYLVAAYLDQKTSTEAEFNSLHQIGVKAVRAERYPGWASAVNYLCRQVIPDADIVVTGGEDQFPDPKKNAQIIGKEYFDHFPDGFGIMQPIGDTFGPKNIAISPWIGKGWIKRAYQGRGPLWNGYWHYYADEELADVARLLKVWWARSDLVQHHDHWQRTSHKRPSHLQKAKEKEGADKGLFLERKKANFPGYEPLMEG